LFIKRKFGGFNCHGPKRALAVHPTTRIGFSGGDGGRRWRCWCGNWIFSLFTTQRVLCALVALVSIECVRGLQQLPPCHYLKPRLRQRTLLAIQDSTNFSY